MKIFSHFNFHLLICIKINVPFNYYFENDIVTYKILFLAILLSWRINS